MDNRYYDLLRNASQEKFYQAINNPEDELYEVLWDIFEVVVIEPAEIFDEDFRDQNQFRYSINGGLVLEFFPEAAYFDQRSELNPYKDDVDAAGIHLRLGIHPHMSCLFMAGFLIWGHPERMAFKRLWREHRDLLSDLFHLAKPMVFTAVPFPTVDHASNLDEMLDNYFSVRDPEDLIEFQYPFAQFDDSGYAQDFMVYMAVLYHSIRDYCQQKKNRLDDWTHHMKEFYSGHLPELPPPLPSVALTPSDF